VEDEEKLLELICGRFKKLGYAVDACADGRDAEDYFAAAEYDCAVLDRMLPGRDGISLLRLLRARGDTTPVLMLTARDALSDRIEGLDAGADDYLTKPFSFDELFARVRALTRRRSVSKDPVLRIADLELDTASRAVTRGGEPISLSAREYSMLEYLMRNCGFVLTREQILNHVWDFDFEGGSNIVDVYIRYLRRKLEGGGEKPLIHTLRGQGYVMEDRG
jgi:DNA-binding response OmpR family regulator